MDAFAVAVSRAMSMKRTINYNQAYLIAASFGSFQAVMPFLGWIAASYFQGYILGIDHWIAFGMLSFIGLKMIYESYYGEPLRCGFGIKELLILSFATSVDALAVGVSFAFLKVNIWSAMLLIGITAFLLSLIGIYIGFHFGKVFKHKAEIVGGLILVVIAVKILAEHL